MHLLKRLGIEGGAIDLMHFKIGEQARLKIMLGKYVMASVIREHLAADTLLLRERTEVMTHAVSVLKDGYRWPSTTRALAHIL